MFSQFRGTYQDFGWQCAAEIPELLPSPCPKPYFRSRSHTYPFSIVYLRTEFFSLWLGFVQTQTVKMAPKMEIVKNVAQNGHLGRFIVYVAGL